MLSVFGLTIIAAGIGVAEDTTGIWTLNVAKSKPPEPLMSAIQIEERSGPDSVRATSEYRLLDGKTRLDIVSIIRKDLVERPLVQTTIVTDKYGKQQFLEHPGLTFGFESIEERNSRFII